MSDDLTLEDLLTYEGLDYRVTSGAKGEQLNIRECPNCGKDKWKVYAGLETSLGNCFSCGKGFNLFGFVRWLLESRGGQPSNRDVGLYIAKVSEALGYRPKKRQAQPVMVAVEDGDVVLPFSTELPFENGNHPYLENRRIGGDWAKRFRLRYSAFGVHRYRNERGEDKKQSFADRIIIPVYDLDGNLKTFQGRDITGFADDKYKFAAGLPGTARYLYNGHTALGLRAREACMGEGAFDVIPIGIALDQYPDSKGVVPIGSWGMHLTRASEGDDQVTAFQRLKRAGLEIVTIMWDGEPKAYERALEAAELLLKIGLRVRIALLPAGKDPNEVDTRVVYESWKNAKEVTRLSMLRMKMHNPYSEAA